MRAHITSFGSPDVDLDTFRPDDWTNVGVFVEITVGSTEARGGEIFGVEVVTPSWLAEKVATTGPLIGRHHLIVNEWNWPATERFLRKMIEREIHDTWDEIAACVGRIALWEFEDYRELEG